MPLEHIWRGLDDRSRARARPVEPNMGNIGEHEQRIRTEQRRKESSRAVLVDDCFDASYRTISNRDRYTSTARADNDNAMLQEQLDCR